MNVATVRKVLGSIPALMRKLYNAVIRNKHNLLMGEVTVPEIRNYITLTTMDYVQRAILITTHNFHKPSLIH